MNIRILGTFPLLLALLATSSACAAASLQPPPGYRAAAGSSGSRSFTCPEAPEPYVGALDFPSKYEGSGKARNEVNDTSNAEYKRRSRPITDLEKGVNKLVGQYIDSGRPEILQCALGWYTRWADARGLQGKAETHTGKSSRKWALAALSGAWLHLKFSASQPLAAHPAETRKVDAWLGQLADTVVSEWDIDQPAERINNHFYWSGWAVMATAVALDRRDLFDWSVKIYRRFASQADSNGYLPNELARQNRALGYHNFAITPLAMIAAFGKANGLDLPEAGNGALGRLANRTLQGIRDPAIFEAKTGFEQAMDGFDEQPTKLAWLEAYCWSVDCSGLAAERLRTLRPMSNARLGGAMTRTFDPTTP